MIMIKLSCKSNWRLVPGKAAAPLQLGYSGSEWASPGKEIDFLVKEEKLHISFRENDKIQMQSIAAIKSPWIFPELF